MAARSRFTWLRILMAVIGCVEALGILAVSAAAGATGGDSDLYLVAAALLFAGYFGIARGRLWGFLPIVAALAILFVPMGPGSPGDRVPRENRLLLLAAMLAPPLLSLPGFSRPSSVTANSSAPTPL